MTSFRQLMERASFTDLEFIAKINQHNNAPPTTYVALGYTGAIMTAVTAAPSLYKAAQQILHSQDVPETGDIERWIGYEPGRVFSLTRRTNAPQSEHRGRYVKVSLTSSGGNEAYKTTLHLLHLMDGTTSK